MDRSKCRLYELTPLPNQNTLVQVLWVRFRSFACRNQLQFQYSSREKVHYFTSLMQQLAGFQVGVNNLKVSIPSPATQVTIGKKVKILSFFLIKFKCVHATKYSKYVSHIKIMIAFVYFGFANPISLDATMQV